MMTDFFVNALENLVAFTAITVIASLCAAALYALTRSPRHGSAPQETRWLVVIALYPWGLGAAVTVLISSPEAASFLLPDHCHETACSPHRPHFDIHSASGLSAVVLAGTALLYCLLLAVTRLNRARRHIAALYRFSTSVGDHRFRIIDSDTPVAWCAGLLRPNIFLSRKLVTALDERQLDSVLNHEIRHMERRDNLRRTLVRGATLIWPRRVRAVYLRDFDVATETACDREAARKSGTGSLLHEARQTLFRLAASGAGTGTTVSGHAQQPPPATPRSGSFDMRYQWLALATLLFSQIVLLTGFSHLALEVLG